MYRIDKQKNRIVPLQDCKFSELGFSERNHLQEWIAYHPKALGEELLIIQKEFDGFDDTRERLDLLALDKDGNIVVIENKLDDSGRDVVWQALKYASYCSSLTKSNIIDIFQGYLNHTNPGKNAREELCLFLEIADIDEAVLNSGISQRLMMVAANFRKEVTSTALWLLGHGISIQCLKVTPFKMEEEVFLNVEQIIPTPEAKELMISMSVKEADEKSTEAEKKQRHQMRITFWEKTLEVFRNSSCSLFNNMSPSKDNWISTGSGIISGVKFTLIFNKDEARVEINAERPEASENKYIFDRLYERRNKIEETFGAPLEWKRLDDGKASRIRFSHEFDGYNTDCWPEIIEWLLINTSKLESAFKQPLIEISKERYKA